jgi:hypothetical protein
MKRALNGLVIVVAIALAASCTAAVLSAAPSTGTAAVLPTPSSSGSASSISVSPSATTPLVGKWRLDRTCAAIVRAVTEAKVPQLIPAVIEELVTTLPLSTDPQNACANAKPPTKHSHTFWPDGRFNSYDENEAEVDHGQWILIDDHTVKIGDPPEAVFTFSVNGDKLSLTPVIPTNCTTAECINGLSWPFSVAFPGENWTRETSGEHVP